MKQVRSNGKLNEHIISQGDKKPVIEKSLTINMQERIIARFYFTYTKFTWSFWKKSKYKRNRSYVKKKITNYVKIHDWSKDVKWNVQSINKNGQL
jgi:hypothetical protein